MKEYNFPQVATQLPKGDTMQTPDEVSQIKALHALGWGAKRIAREMGISKNTVKRYLHAQGWQPYGPGRRKTLLDDHKPWLEEQFYRHQGNAEVIRQELDEQFGITVSLRTVERAVQPFRERLKSASKATVRFETEPGQQLQIDFGSKRIVIASEKIPVHLFVATLGFSRRIFIKVFLNQRQYSWFDGIESTFNYFGGLSEQVLLDNPKPLVNKHNLMTGEVEFNRRFLSFSRYWGFHPRACAPYRARTKGKDERSIQYVKRNAIAGREFDSLEALQIHLLAWTQKIADQRIHGTTGERPIDRFEREALQPLEGRPPFTQIREVVRRVHNDACVEVDTNWYSVPWHFIGQQVTVLVADNELKVFANANEIARHMQSLGTRQRSICPSHLQGIVGASKVVNMPAALGRPLSEYEAVVGGR